MCILKTLKLRYELKLANRTLANKVEYLRKQGCEIGKNTRLLCHTSCFGSEPYMVKVGDDCLFSHNINIFTHDGGVKVLNSLNYFDGKAMDKIGCVTIGNNCFIGNSAKIMPGVTIGDNVIVGSGAIVTKDVPSNSVVAGVPAKIICTIEEYYQKNIDNFIFIGGMNYEQKKEHILNVTAREN